MQTTWLLSEQSQHGGHEGEMERGWVLTFLKLLKLPMPQVLSSRLSPVCGSGFTLGLLLLLIADRGWEDSFESGDEAVPCEFRDVIFNNEMQDIAKFPQLSDYTHISK